MNRRFRLGERVELTPGARKAFPQHVPAGLVVGVGGTLMRIQHDGQKSVQTWHMRHWQTATSEERNRA